MMIPVIDGLTACAIFLDVFVIPAAAVLSSWRTIATIYDCRVGTSIWDKLILARYNPSAMGNVGANATRMSRMFDAI